MVLRSPAQVGVTFSKDELGLLEKLDQYCETTGASRSAAVKKCLAAVLEDDDETLRRMRGFSEDRLPVGPDEGIIVAA